MQQITRDHTGNEKCYSPILGKNIWPGHETILVKCVAAVMMWINNQWRS